MTLDHDDSGFPCAVMRSRWELVRRDYLGTAEVSDTSSFFFNNGKPESTTTAHGGVYYGGLSRLATFLCTAPRTPFNQSIDSIGVANIPVLLGGAGAYTATPGNYATRNMEQGGWGKHERLQSQAPHAQIPDFQVR